MKNPIPLLLCAALFAGQPAIAAPGSSPSIDALSTCLTDSTSGRDRKDLARWIFLAMSMHPEIRSLSSASAATRTEADKTMAALVMRLLTVDCQKQTKEVSSHDGNAGLFTAFKSLGEVAMRELISNPDVTASVSGYTQYLDKKKLEAALGKAE